MADTGMIRREAERCRRLAQSISDPEKKAALEKTADELDAMAEAVESEQHGQKAH